jgi:hypothetical protein
MNTLITALIDLLIVGLVLYLINLLPIDGAIKQIIRVVAIVVAIVWLLSLLTGYGGMIHIG